MSQDPARAAGRRRLFAGIALDDAARAACAAVAVRLRATGFAARFEEPAKLHLTLAFLGNVDAARVDDVVESLRSAAAGRARFELALDKLGAFPNERRPRVVYIGAGRHGADFRGLAETVRAAYHDRGFHFGDDPVAHVTIARVKQSRRPLPLVDVAPIALCVAGLTLFESVFDNEKNTSRYEVLFQSPLA